MNTFFYMAIDRTDLGKSVAIEFIGPIVVAAAMTRTAPQRRRPRCSPSSACSCSAGVELDGNTIGLLWLLAASAMWAAYIVRRLTRRPASTAASPGLGVGLAVGAVVLLPFGAPGQRRRVRPPRGC